MGDPWIMITDRQITPQEAATVLVQSNVGSDDDLPDVDKRSRGGVLKDAAGSPLVPQCEVSVIRNGLGMARYIRKGRGAQWALLAWHEPEFGIVSGPHPICKIKVLGG
jgi:hypothetical protein